MNYFLNVLIIFLHVAQLQQP